jgi:hypothetical protein
MSKTKTRRRRGNRAPDRKRGSGLMLGMRSGFKGVARAVSGEEARSSSRSSSRWTGRIVMLLLVAAAVGLLLSRL